jgi:hypothetical protein
MPYLGPQHLFLFEKCCLKSEHFFGAAPYPKDTSGVARRGMCPLLFEEYEGAAVPLIAKNFLNL